MDKTLDFMDDIMGAGLLEAARAYAQEISPQSSTYRAEVAIDFIAGAMWREEQLNT